MGTGDAVIAVGKKRVTPSEWSDRVIASKPSGRRSPALTSWPAKALTCTSTQPGPTKPAVTASGTASAKAILEPDRATVVTVARSMSRTFMIDPRDRHGGGTGGTTLAPTTAMA